MEPDLFEEFAREFVAEVNRQRAHTAGNAELLRKKIDRLDRQISRLVDVIVDGGDARALNSKLKEGSSRKGHA